MSLLEETNIAQKTIEMELYIAPPLNVGELTDEDSADEDTGGTFNNLNPHQLDAEAELVVLDYNNDERRVDEENIDTLEETITSSPCTLDIGNSMGEPPQTIPTKEGKRKKGKKLQIQEKNKKFSGKQKTVVDRCWANKDIPDTNVVHINLKNEKLYNSMSKPNFYSRPLTPIDFFQFFFSEDLLQIIVKETVKYAIQKGTPIELGVDEMKLFLGVLILSGYDAKPRRRMYWEEADDVRNILVSRSIRRNKFETIMKYLHFNDNTKLDTTDRLFKLSPIIKELKKSFLEFNIWDTESSIDEAMIPYFGRHGMKQHIQGKPIRFGYKAWCWNKKNGYLIDFDIYQGAKGRNNAFKEEFGLGGSIVMNFCQTIPKMLDGSPQPHCIYTDNYFTSLRLVDKLTDMGIGITGTIRSNRIEKCPLNDNMKRTPRGTYDYLLDTNHNLFLCRWNDNSTVTLVSNHEGIKPIYSAKRYSFVEKEKITITQPYLIQKYNENMGGTDRMDQNVAQYRTSIRSKKWYWPIFAWLLDVSIQNAWHLYREMREELPGEQKMDLLAFRRYIAQSWIGSYAIPRKRSGK